MNEAQKGWVAGIIDGEGYIGIQQMFKGNHDYLYVFIAVQMTSELTIDKLIEITGVGVKSAYTPRILSHKVKYQWRVNGDEKVCELLTALLEYLVTKRDHAELVLSFFGASKLHKEDIMSDLRILNMKGRRAI